MKTNSTYFITVSIVLLILTAVWVAGLGYTIMHHNEWSHGINVGLGWTLALSGLGILSIWGKWFTVGFRAMGAK